MRPLRLISILCIPLLASCSILGLRKQVGTLEKYGAATLVISPPPAGPAPTYALAWTFENGERKESAGFQRLRADGIASMGLRADRLYRIGAFTDENDNGKYDAGEPLAVVKDVKPAVLSEPGAKPAIFTVTLKRDRTLPAGTVIAIPKANAQLGAKLGVALGDVVLLDDKRFAPDAGGSGLWKPVEFLTKNTMGIYFTEPYDPKRIPVVLVYGIGGSPQDWRYFAEHFDRRRYQVWFYHYPSGMRLERVARTLATGLRMLRQRHGFAHCDVVAHSMGGLVSHAAIRGAAEGVNFIPRFVTISTPWGGHAAAEQGIRHLKNPVPSWLDVAPGSDFLAVLHATPLPSGTRHDMIYGSVKGGPFYLKGENDGVVTVASETDARIAKRAASVTHFPCGHVEILGRGDTLAKVFALLGK